MLEKIKQTANYLKERTNFQPEVGIILGTGLGNLGNEIKAEHAIPLRRNTKLPGIYGRRAQWAIDFWRIRWKESCCNARSVSFL